MEKQLELEWETAVLLATAPSSEPHPNQTDSQTLELAPEPANGILSAPELGPSPPLIVETTATADATDLSSTSRQRVCWLEQALDQCQCYIDELKTQLVQQEFLEKQLAITEDVSNIQQQAIATLKAQLADQQDLAAQAASAREQKQTTEAALQHSEALVKHQQLELEQLRSQVELDTQTVSHLQQELQTRQSLIDHLEARLEQTKQAIANQQEIAATLQQFQGSDSNKNKVIQGLSKSLLQAQNKIEALEAEFSNQLILQAQLQHSCQELEAQRLQSQERIRQMEFQITEMQEQILHQAQQTSEYETAIQHWKDRCLDAEQTVMQLKAVLEQLLIERNLAEHPAASVCEIGGSGNGRHHESPNPLTHGSLKGLKLDLPAFLQRHPRFREH